VRRARAARESESTSGGTTRAQRYYAMVHFECEPDVLMKVIFVDVKVTDVP
jgi:hypothetical protein